MSNLVEKLRKNCVWQRTKGTSDDNGYPYHKHIPDCDICQSADHMEKLQVIVDRLASYKQISDTKIDPLCSAIEAKARIEYAAKHANITRINRHEY